MSDFMVASVCFSFTAMKYDLSKFPYFQKWLLASVERRPKGKGTEYLMQAEDVLAAVLRDTNERKGLADRLLQVGGDATTGRGLIVVHPSGEGV